MSHNIYTTEPDEQIEKQFAELLKACQEKNLRVTLAFLESAYSVYQDEASGLVDEFKSSDTAPSNNVVDLPSR